MQEKPRGCSTEVVEPGIGFIEMPMEKGDGHGIRLQVSNQDTTRRVARHPNSVMTEAEATQLKARPPNRARPVGQRDPLTLTSRERVRLRVGTPGPVDVRGASAPLTSPIGPAEANPSYNIL